MSALRIFDKFAKLLDVSWSSIADGQTLKRSGTNIVGAAGGDVVGPASAATGNVASYSGTTGKLITDSGKVAADVVTGPASVTTGRIATYNGTTGKIIQDGAKLAADLVVGPASSVDSEIALFSGTGGKTIQRATGTGYVTVVNGVYQTPAARPSSVLFVDAVQEFNNTGTWKTVATYTVPAGTLVKVGDALKIRTSWRALGASAAKSWGITVTSPPGSAAQTQLLGLTGAGFLVEIETLMFLASGSAAFVLKTPWNAVHVSTANLAGVLGIASTTWNNSQAIQITADCNSPITTSDMLFDYMAVEFLPAP